MARPLVTFHAPPDAESLLTAGVMAKAAAEGRPSDIRDVVSDLPPVEVHSKAERDALPRGRRYTLPGDNQVRVKKEHDQQH